MTKKTKNMRIVVNGVLLAAIIAMGVTVYQAGNERDRDNQLAQEEKEHQEQEQASLEEEQAEVESEEQENLVDVGTSQVEAQLDSSEESVESADMEAVEEETAHQAATETVEMTTEEPVSAIPEVNFTEDTLMIWPLAGDVVLDYSMEQTIYHPTLDQYRCSEGIAIASAVESPVLSAANGTISTIAEDAQTGTTMTVDMGNGYQAIYGQLQNVQVAEGQTVGQSTILGYVAEPTKYYSEEGSNLYFAMKKDGQPIDPVTYLP